MQRANKKNRYNVILKVTPAVFKGLIGGGEVSFSW